MQLEWLILYPAAPWASLQRTSENLTYPHMIWRDAFARAYLHTNDAPIASLLQTSVRRRTTTDRNLTTLTIARMTGAELKQEQAIKKAARP
ncbi:hypothetical protein Q9Q94_04215 [Uliginosibacterium sp. 31-16]|uniref:hypothetical protein n=1 Tax=Uliginosibacterium sp. 31-16 TaxID=3068315 RepID=UPI00274022F2|nr:hypothetical protein [Uliginosibacterium sp. 31-16]MDP5238718.1 hypothetical protein [Uliginosibacterium sp. 31-16]